MLSFQSNCFCIDNSFANYTTLICSETNPLVRLKICQLARHISLKLNNLNCIKYKTMYLIVFLFYSKLCSIIYSSVFWSFNVCCCVNILTIFKKYIYYVDYIVILPGEHSNPKLVLLSVIDIGLFLTSYFQSSKAYYQHKHIFNLSCYLLFINSNLMFDCSVFSQQTKAQMHYSDIHSIY